MHIQDQVFIVTGASSGLGAAVAERLIAGGGRVLVADLNAQAGAARAEQLGDRACFQQGDVTSAADAEAIIAAAQRQFGALHGLINCAGVAPGERVLGRQGPHRLESFARTIEINLIGTFNLLRLAAAAMAEGEPNAEGERGIIINTASIAAFEGQIGQAAYAASKAGVVGMTLPIARELARFGIRVMTVAPGIFETAMVADFSAEVRDSLAASIPFPSRLGRAQEFAALVEHIIANPMLNGEVIRLDGALRMAER